MWYRIFSRDVLHFSQTLKPEHLLIQYVTCYIRKLNILKLFLKRNWVDFWHIIWDIVSWAFHVLFHYVNFFKL